MQAWFNSPFTDKNDSNNDGIYRGSLPINYGGSSSRRKVKEDLNDISMGEERFQLSVMSKASTISSLEYGVKIGPDNHPVGSLSNKAHSTSCLAMQSHQKEELLPRMLKNEDRKIFRNDTSGIVEKLLYELEQERHAEVQEKMRVRLEKLEYQAREREKEVIQKQANLKCKAEDRADIERREAQQLQREQAFQENQRQVNLVLAQQKRAQEQRQLIMEASQQAEASRKLKEVKINHMNKIKQFEKTFYATYQQLLEIIGSCKDLESLQATCSSSLQMIKSLNEAVVQLVHQCLVGEVSSLDLQTAATIIHQFENCYKIIEESVKLINLETQEKCAKENAQKQQEEENKVDTSNLSTVSDVSAHEETTTKSLHVISDFVDDESLQVYAELKDYLRAFKESMSNLTQDRRLKEFMFNCRKAVNIPVNAISNVSAAHLHDKLKRLTFLLLGETINLEDCRFSAKMHPQGIAYCMDLLASKLVSQGKTTVSSQPEAAFPLAAVIVSLWAEFPEFGKLLLANFHQACPYLVPVYLPQIEGQSNEDYLKLLGYKFDDAGNVEKQDQFLKKMSGIMRLYAAVMITPLRQQQRQPHPHGISQAWRWIACMLNLEPSKDITATLLLDFLEVGGNAMAATYGMQFQKLLHLICKDYFHRIQKIDERSGPTSRLEVFLQASLKRGSIPKPQGLLPPNFW